MKSDHYENMTYRQIIKESAIRGFENSFALYVDLYAWYKRRKQRKAEASNR